MRRFTADEARRLTVEELMAEVAKRVKPIRSDLLGTKTVPNTERTDSNGLVWITETTYGYAEERLREDRKVFPWLKRHDSLDQSH